jgi:2'-5' RNA ligase
LRLFLALDIPAAIRDRISRFIEGVTGFAPEARWMDPKSLHITLKFIGEQPDSALDQIKQSLSQIHAETTEINFRNYGFFPTAKSPRVFWIGVESGPQLAALAASIDDTLSSLGIERELRPYSPHLTLARVPGASGSPRRIKSDAPTRIFHHLQEKLAARPTPEFGTMTPREFFLYQSRVSPKGSKYTKRAAFDLK